MKYFNIQELSAQPMNVNFATPAQQLNEVIAYSFQAVYSGSLITGSFHLEGSCDQYCSSPGSSTNPPVQNWTTIANTSVAVSAGGSSLWSIEFPGYNWVRAVYTDSSGGTSNGVCNIRFNAK